MSYNQNLSQNSKSQNKFHIFSGDQANQLGLQRALKVTSLDRKVGSPALWT